jgi:hypothetical protein
LLTPAATIAFVGFGDAERLLALPLTRRGITIRAFDAAQSREQIEAAGADPASTPAAALRGARLVVMAADCGVSLRSVAPLLSAGQICLDLAGPALPDDIALMESGNAHYIAGRTGTPLLLRGARAIALAAALDSMGCPALAVEQLPDAELQPRPLPDILTAPLRRGELP